MTWVSGSYRIIPAVASILKTLSIESLTLDEVVFRDIAQFAGFMDIFPSVENVSFKNVYCNTVSKNDKAPVSSRTNVIRLLHLSVKKISTAASDLPLTSVGNPIGEEVVPLLTLLQNPSLQHVCVNSGYTLAVKLLRIQTLVIHLKKVEYTREFCISLKLWTDSLACGEESSLTKLTIHFDMRYQISANDAKQWVVPDKALSASDFPKLVSLRVILKTAAGIEVEQTKQPIETHCQILYTRNVLTLEVEGSYITQK